MLSARAGLVAGGSTTGFVALGDSCLAYDYGLSVDLARIPTKANPADAPSSMVSLQEWWAEVDDLLRGSTPNLHSKIPVFSDPAPGKS